MARIITTPEQAKLFVEDEKWFEIIDTLVKSDLLCIADYLGLSLSTEHKKKYIKKRIIMNLDPEEELSDEDESPVQTHSEVEVWKLKLELKKFECEEKEKEREEKEKDRVEREKERAEREKEIERAEREKERERAEREIERKHELEMAKLRLPVSVSEEDSFDLSKCMKLVPKFDESDVTNFFITFEKIARSLKWPERKWVFLIQSVLEGKAAKVWAMQPPEDSEDYEKIKELILKAYELVPEAYRIKFRNWRKKFGQTFLDFSRDTERLFNDWLRSVNVVNFDSLKQLVLVENFKNSLTRDLRTHLEEKEVKTLERAARLADEYVLTHRNFSKTGMQNRYDASDSSSSQSASKSPVKENKFSKIVCHGCGKTGHLKKNCNSKAKPVALVAAGRISSGVVPQLNELSKEDKEGYKWFLSKGSITHNGKTKEIVILRDTGATQTLLLRSALPDGYEQVPNEHAVVKGLDCKLNTCPLVQVDLSSSLYKGSAKLAVVYSLPVSGVDLLLANDLAEGKIDPYPILLSQPSEDSQGELNNSYPIGVVTRSKADRDRQELDLGLDTLFESECRKREEAEVPAERKQSDSQPNSSIIQGTEELAVLQGADPKIKRIIDGVEAGTKLEDRFVMKNGILMKKLFSQTEPLPDRVESFQVVIPEKYRPKILELAHDDKFSGHMGVAKTLDRVRRNFYWPGMKADISKFCKTCHTCQVIGKPNEVIPKAPLKPIPSLGEPLENIIIDVVGPLPKSKQGSEYILTIIDRTTRYPEGIPLKRITTRVIVKHLIKFFSRFGMPKTVQSDQGQNFVSKEMQKQLKSLGIQHFISTPYHPESQGVVERFHQTLKSMFKKFCQEKLGLWEDYLPYFLFAIRSVPNCATGFSPFQLLFGHTVKGPLDLLKESWMEGTSINSVEDWVDSSRGKLMEMWELAKENLSDYQSKMKDRYDIKSQKRSFMEGQNVLVFMQPKGQKLRPKFMGPYPITKKVNDYNYVVQLPDRKMRCHINMLKSYHDRDPKPVAVSVSETIEEEMLGKSGECESFRNNSEVLKNLHLKLKHLTEAQQKQLSDLIKSFPEIFKDVPGRTSLIEHDIELTESKPIKQYPYRVNMDKKEAIKKEVSYMLENDLIQPSFSDWSSPVVLVKKSNGQYRMCFDYRKVNSITVNDNFPIPRIDDCIDQVGNAKYITKFDMTKGYWQVPLSPRAQKVSSFVTSDGLFECKVMPFGLKNAAATFQRLMNKVIANIKNCLVYIDDVIIFSDTWEEHVQLIKEFFCAVREAGLVLNLTKSDFACGKVTYLGHEVGKGIVAPRRAKVCAIDEFPIPTNRKQVMQFLGLAGFYRRFVANFSEVTAPLSNLLKKNVKFQWDERCTNAFESVKYILTSDPILISPNFNKPFSLAVDASENGVGGVLMQRKGDFNHPVAYFSKKLNSHQKNYAVIEKEGLALILSLQHFDVYLSSSSAPIEVFSDHDPIKFIKKFSNKNMRLTRWSIFLQDYNIEVKHIKGKDNVVPDVLSRLDK